MKKVWLLFLISSMALFACNQNDGNEQGKNQFSQEPQSVYNVEITEMKWPKFADSLFLKFKIINTKTNEKDFWGDLKPSDAKIVNDKIEIGEIKKLNRGKGNIPDNILVSLLIDKSIFPEDMDKVRGAVKFFVNNLPENTVCISFFDNTVSKSEPITSQTFSSFEQEFKTTTNSKIIFGATLNKFQELTGENTSSLHSEIARQIQNDTIKKYLILLTDGKSNATGEEADNITAFYNAIQSLDNETNQHNQIEIHAIRYGQESPNVDKHLSFICKDLRKDNVKGEFYAAAPDSVLNKLSEVIDKLSPDYEFVLKNVSGRIYSGENRDFKITIEKNGKKAFGIKPYTIGTQTNPIITGTTNATQRTLLGLFWGFIILFVSYFVIQVIVPFFIFKTSNFEKKYVRKYKPNEDEIIKCNICLEDLIEGEKVVEKCQHKTHSYCWKENGRKCSEYGQNCKDGKQYYFDKDKPFSSANSPYFMKWVLYGMCGGLLSWIIYQLIILLDPLLFESLTKRLLIIFYPADWEKPELWDIQTSFITKIGPLLLIGLLLGFILTFLFSYINEYRKKRGKVLGEMLLRSLIGSCFGFLAFLIGSIIIIACKASGINIWIDWIPWLLFGGSLGLCLSVKTDIVWKHALLGGVISGLISFVLLFLSRWFGNYAVLFSFMLYSAGLGLSIVTIHHVAQKYFLKYKGAKEGEIAIHKWMSVLGGSNDVTIGKSNQCIIQMNWDNNETIQNIHAKLYVDKKLKSPHLKVLGDNLLFNGNLIRKNDEFQLKNGVTFKIGDTEFQYIEKV